MSWGPANWAFPGVEIFVFLSPWLPKGWIFLGVSILIFIAVTAAGMFFTLKARDAEAQKLGRELFWATFAAYTVMSIGHAFVLLKNDYRPTFLIFAIDKMPGSFVWVSLVFFLFYWPIPLLILFRYKNDLHRLWHVWTVWGCTTLFLAWELLAHQKDGPLIMSFGFASAPIITALGGIFIGELVFRLQTMLGLSLPSNVASAARKIFVRSFLFWGLVSIALVSFERLNEPALPEAAKSNAIVRIGKLSRVIQDGGIIACPNPSDTLSYVDIITGRQTPKGSQESGAVAAKAEILAAQAAFLKDDNSRTEKCEFYRDTEKVFVQEERKTLNGIELLCLKGWSQGVCYWSLAAEIDVYGGSFLGRLRRSIY
jgi:hypothetical protein